MAVLAQLRAELTAMEDPLVAGGPDGGQVGGRRPTGDQYQVGELRGGQGPRGSVGRGVDDD